MSEEKPEDGQPVHDEIVANVSEAPTIFIDGIHGMHLVNGVFKIGLYQIIQDLTPINEGKEGTFKRVIIARLAMSPGTLLKLKDWLDGVLIEMVEPDDGADA